ncbi:hypothetical protein K1719_003884 [Acacia pycnantha]|nr:hypothetical protein K1719_003884 [Acacia pycnantha]
MVPKFRILRLIPFPPRCRPRHQSIRRCSPETPRSNGALLARREGQPPPRDTRLSKVVGLLKTPDLTTVGTSSGAIVSIVRGANQIKDQRESRDQAVFSGMSVVYFKKASNEQCQVICPFINALCIRYPHVKFIKVDVEQCTRIAKAKSIIAVLAFRIYANGKKVMEMIRPNPQLLEDSVRNLEDSEERL